VIKMKLLIADDDEQIRSGIEQGIDWSALDIKQVITASNGLEALQLFTEFLPEIVITDVRMPGMDGLELLRKIKEKKPQTRVIILSGYNDFNYLKKAIQLGAVDYEMKPIRARNLIALIKNVKEEIIRHRVTEQEFHKYLDSYKTTFVEELLSGKITDQLIVMQGLQQYYNFHATGSILCISAQMDGDLRKNQDGLKSVADTINHLFATSDVASRGVILWSKEDKFLLLMMTETQSYLYNVQFANEMTKRLRAWSQKLNTIYPISFSAGISSPGSVSEFGKLYHEANQALSMRLYEGSNSIKVYDRSMELKSSMIIGLLENIDFILKLSQGDFASIVMLVNSEYDRLKKERKYSRKSVSAYTRKLIQQVMVTVSNIPVDMIYDIQGQIEFIEGNEEILVIDEFRNIVVHIVKKIGKRLSKNLSPAMIRADEFIRKNYTCDLSVGVVAEHVGKTPNYFSHLFKREFGISFKEYVTRLRIDKAKELILNTNELIYEIGGKVGFCDYTYFTQVFKKMEGFSPGELRRRSSENVVIGD
jgi:two-component system, response regulator YesN